MKSFVAVAILALACSASATFIRSFPVRAANSVPFGYYYHPSIRTIPAPLAYSSPIWEEPKTILTKSIHTPLVYSAPVVEAPKTGLFKGVPAPIAYRTLPEVSYAYTPIVHQKGVAAQPEPSYIASSRGATYIAPLPGFSGSVISQNLETQKN